MNARGDLVVCVFAPNSQGDVISMNSSAAEEGNAARFGSPVSVLRCFALHLPEPLLLPAVNTGHQHKVSVSIQSVSHLVDIPCSSAQPVRSVPIPLAPFARKDNSVSGTSQNRSRKCTSRFHSHDRDTFATDILIVPHRLQVGSGWPIFRLYRAGTIHVADFTLPQTTLEAVDSSLSISSFLAVNIENSVGNRVDIHFFCPDGLLDASVEAITASTKKKYSQATAIVRASFSLLMHTSSITETALRAIESSLVYNTAESTTEQFPASSWGVNLSLLIRSDVVRLSQQRSSVGRGNIIPNNVEDAGWYSLTVVLLHLLGMKRSAEEEQAGVCAYQTGRKTTKKQSSAAWEALLQSEHHSSFCAGEGAILFGAVDEFVENSFRTKVMSISDCEFTAELLSVLPFVTNFELDAAARDAGTNNTPTYAYLLRHHIFDSLHLLHEDSRLVSTSRGFSWTLRLGTFLMHVAKQMNPMMIDYEDHYHRLLGTSRCQSNACTSYSTPKKEKHRLSTFAISPCIMTFLDGIIQLNLDDYSLEDASYWVAGYNALLQSALNGVLSTTWMVLRLFVLRFDRKNILSVNRSVIDAEPTKSHRDRAVILAMLDEGIYHPFQLQDELPMGVVLPLLEIIASCRLDPPHVDSTRELWPPAAYDLVGRNDIAEFLAQSKDGSHGILFADDASPSDDPDGDGLSALDNFASLTFPDNRIRDAARLLRSSHPLFLNAPRPVELSDHEYERSKQEKLLLLCRRSIALPLGRGMLTLGTHSVQSAEQLLIPNIVLAGRVPPMNGILALDTTALPNNFRVWPEFHNGVAAGLRLPQATKDEHARQVTRTWIKFNKPMSASDNSSPSYSHGGILMALGLRGYLSALTT